MASTPNDRVCRPIENNWLWSLRTSFYESAPEAPILFLFNRSSLNVMLLWMTPLFQMLWSPMAW